VLPSVGFVFMADDDALLGWFYQLGLDDQVAILSDPHAALPPQLVQSLAARPVAPTWVAPESPTRWLVTHPLADTLDAKHKQLDKWWRRWQRHAPERCASLIQRRGDELGEDDYQHMIMDVGPPIGVITGDHLDQTGRFWLPPLLAVFLELKARQAQSS
jgi:hypothetical protein